MDSFHLDDVGPAGLQEMLLSQSQCRLASLIMFIDLFRFLAGELNVRTFATSKSQASAAAVGSGLKQFS